MAPALIHPTKLSALLHFMGIVERYLTAMLFHFAQRLDLMQGLLAADH